MAVAEVDGGRVQDWQEFDVGWGALHDSGSEGSHHARIARFLRDHGVEAVAVGHLGPGMQRMLQTMGIRVVSGSSGDGRRAASGLG